MTVARIALALLTLSAAPALADVKLRPGDKLMENNKDFLKDKAKTGYATPEPQSRSYPFVTGGQVTVEIEAATSFLGAVKFTLKDLPQHGTLGTLLPHPSGDSNKMLITYTHGGDAAQLVDRFTFQAKIGDGNTSTVGVISLMGKRAAPQIEVLEHPKFKRLAPGETDSGRVVLLNSGTAPFKGEVQWPAPFVGPPSIELAVKEKQTFLIMIKPERPGSYRLDQEVQRTVPSSRVMGLVECVQAYLVEPSLLDLKFDASKGNRSATLKVSNSSDSPLVLELEAHARLSLDKGLTLDPRASKEITVSLPDNDVTPFRGEVWVKQSTHRDKIVVQAEAEPAQLAWRVRKSPSWTLADWRRGRKARPPSP
jgi:hypothetical protein